jgi:hypothetical protein
MFLTVFTKAVSILSLLFNYTHKAEWTLFQTHYFSENLITPRIEPGPLDLYRGTTEAILIHETCAKIF